MPDHGNIPLRRRVPRTKVTIPGPPEDLVSRPRLLAILDDAAEATTVFLGAPAGFGKTVLLAGWARHRGSGTVAWVSADTGDNDERLFWSAILEALGGCARIPAASPLRTLGVPPVPSADLAFLAQVADALDVLPEPVLLVLDGVQEITAPGIWQGLRTLLRHQPAGLRLALSSRREPPLPLGRARLADRLAELGADELRFTPAEVRLFVEVTGAAIGPDQLGTLIARTEGWPAALRLAVSSSARHGDLHGFFAGRDRAVLDYLVDEVLDPLNVGQRELVRAISVCDEVPVGLAAALAGRADVEVMLHQLGGPATRLVRANGTPPCYRLPPLLRTYLRSELFRREPERTRALHAAAARWFAGHDRPASALLHSVRAGDVTWIGSLLRRHAVTLYLAGEHQVLRLALAVLDDHAVSADPLLALVSAVLCLEAGETPTAALRLARVEAAWPDHPATELIVLRQLAYSRRAQLDRPRAQAARAAERIDVVLAGDTELGGLAMLHRVSGLPDRAMARTELVRVLGRAEERGQDFLVTQCLTVLSRLACRDGDYRVMDTLARRVVARQRAHERHRALEGAQAATLLALSALLRGEPAECVEEANRVERLLDDAPARTARDLRMVAETLCGAAEFELGGWHAGLRRMRHARSLLGSGRTFPAEHVALCAVLEHRAALRFGAAGQARETLRWSQPVLARSGELLLMRARTQLCLGRQSSARSVLRSLADEEAPMLLPWSAIEARLIGVHAALAAGAAERAERLLDQALRDAEPADIRFPFVFAPPEVIGLLTARLGELGSGEWFAGQVLTRRRRLRTQPMPAPLTERERSVLRLLPTQRSIDEIAEDLTVSPNTVKTHVRGIYTKLDVRSRRDAVAIALQRGLLDAEVTDFIS